METVSKAGLYLIPDGNIFRVSNCIDSNGKVFYNITRPNFTGPLQVSEGEFCWYFGHCRYLGDV